MWAAVVGGSDEDAIGPPQHEVLAEEASPHGLDTDVAGVGERVPQGPERRNVAHEQAGRRQSLPISDG